MTYAIAVKVNDQFLVGADSQAIFGNKPYSSNWVKIFHVPNRSRHDHEFLVAGAGNFGAIYRARDELFSQRRLGNIDDVNSILAGIAYESKEDEPSKRTQFISIGPDDDRQGHLFHINPEYEKGIKECRESVQIGSGFKFVTDSARSLKLGPDFRLDSLESAVRVFDALLREVSERHDYVDDILQIGVAEYGKKGKVGILYPQGINSEISGLGAKFWEEYIGLMTGITSLLKGCSEEYRNNQYLMVSLYLSEFYDRFNSVLRQASSSLKRGELDDESLDHLKIGLEYLMEGGPSLASFNQIIKEETEFSRRVMGGDDQRGDYFRRALDRWRGTLRNIRRKNPHASLTQS